MFFKEVLCSSSLDLAYLIKNTEKNYNIVKYYYNLK